MNLKAMALLALLSGCAVAEGKAPLDMSTPVESEFDQCRGPKDEGKKVVWVFVPDYNMDERMTTTAAETDMLARRFGRIYVCKDHGKDHHGWWWEQLQ